MVKSLAAFLLFYTCSLCAYSEVFESLSHMDALSYGSHNGIFEFEESDIEFFLKRYDNEKYLRVRNNEFEKFDALKQIRSDIQSHYSDAIEKRIYATYVKGEFGEYDMDRGFFPLESFDQGTSIQIRPPNSPSYSLEWVINGHFINAGAFNKLPLEFESARELVSDRTSKSGFVNRDVLLHVEYKILPNQKNYVGYGRYHSYSRPVIYLEIVGFKILDGENDSRVLYDSHAKGGHKVSPWPNVDTRVKNSGKSSQADE